MTITDFNSDSSCLPSLTCNMDVRVHIGRSTGRSTPHGQEWQFQVSFVSGFYCYSSYRQITWQIYPPVAKNGNFRFLLFQVSIVTAHIGRSPVRSMPPVHASSGQEWKFQSSIVSYRQINWQIYPPLQASSGQEWQFQISIVLYRQINWQIYPLPPRGIQWPRMAIADFYCSSSYRHINWQI